MECEFLNSLGNGNEDIYVPSDLWLILIQLFGYNKEDMNINITLGTHKIICKE